MKVYRRKDYNFLIFNLRLFNSKHLNLVEKKSLKTNES